MDKEDEARHAKSHAGQHDALTSLPETSESPARRKLPHTASSYFGQSADSSTPLATPGTATPSGLATPGGTRKTFFLRRTKTTNSAAGSMDSNLNVKPQKNKRFRKKKKEDFNLDAESNRDILGIVVMEIKSAADLPKLKSCELIVVICGTNWS
jgi:phosphatidylserine decarboxylase